ncbi:unnamed protein product [Bursaphelenchus okinawaensis]|uniref:Uncharacterized protein n=1 Tax=Bursaphelenchus okinawaensis TaxID=465554 RepID=A0A811KPA7_9BILA|nr:unnamed protein product [Bursaphelenchus okinawaensis]CAG9107555.1 unnamed protein product [Bursaphelenchus okinawaensis]
MKAMSMASIITKEIKFNGGGPYTYRQVGEFQRKFNTSAHPNPDELPSYGQLFMVEADEACGIRYNIMKQLNKGICY